MRNKIQIFVVKIIELWKQNISVNYTRKYETNDKMWDASYNLFEQSSWTETRVSHYVIVTLFVQYLTPTRLDKTLFTKSLLDLLPLREILATIFCIPTMTR